MAHKTLVNGTAYEIGGGKTLAGGTAYQIGKGKTLVDGTAYEVGFGVPMSDLAVGTSVFVNVDGVRTEFLVVHQGLPDATMYDNSCDGTWLLMKNCYTQRVWTEQEDYYIVANNYEQSAIRDYLENTFAPLIDSSVQSIIKQVKIPYVKGGGQTGTICVGNEGLLSKVFLVSLEEIIKSGMIASYSPQIGESLDYFENGGSVQAYYGGSAIRWWTRSPCFSTAGVSVAFANVFIAGPQNSTSYATVNLSYGVRPAFILPSDTPVDDNFNVIA